MIFDPGTSHFGCNVHFIFKTCYTGQKVHNTKTSMERNWEILDSQSCPDSKKLPNGTLTDDVIVSQYLQLKVVPKNKYMLYWET